MTCQNSLFYIPLVIKKQSLTILSILLVLSSLFNVYLVYNSKSDTSNNQKSSSSELPFFYNSFTSEYFEGDDGEICRITARSEVSDEFIHPLCENCTFKTTKIGSKDIKLWFNPSSKNVISIIFSPSRSYGGISEFQIDNFRDKDEEVEFTPEEVNAWLEYVKDW